MYPNNVEAKQKCIDYTEKWPLMVIFLYNQYIFVWINHSCNLACFMLWLSAIVFVIKRLWHKISCSHLLFNKSLVTRIRAAFRFKIYSRLVISKSKGFSEILRDIRTSTYQICRIVEKLNQTSFNKWICNLTPEVDIYWKYCGKEKKSLLESNFSFFHNIL